MSLSTTQTLCILMLSQLLSQQHWINKILYRTLKFSFSLSFVFTFNYNLTNSKKVHSLNVVLVLSMEEELNVIHYNVSSLLNREWLKGIFTFFILLPSVIYGWLVYCLLLHHYSHFCGCQKVKLIFFTNSNEF